MRVYDGFPFFNELDLLEIRLNELNDVVDHFVIVEAERTHQNKPKPLYYREVSDDARFAKFKDKIINIVIPADKFGPHAWDNERCQFTAVVEQGLEGADDDDMIIYSAADEIPRSTEIEKIKRAPHDDVRCMHMNFYYFYLDTRYNGDWGTSFWPGSVVAKMRNIKSDPYGVFYGTRNNHLGLTPNGGWHFSYMGDVDNAMYKIQSQCELHFNSIPEESVGQARESLTDPMCRDARSHFVAHEPLEELPQYVSDNIDKFKKHLHQLK